MSQIVNYNPIYCSECYHVYYQKPETNRCAICNNEIIESNKVQFLDFLSCETCHSIYTIQNIEEIIPKNINNPNFLCSCKHKCPTTSILEVAQQEAYIGTIVLTKLKKCTNCNAVTLPNRESSNKMCQSCGSKFLQPINWKSDKHNLIYSCANPNHGLRLKIRDILAGINQKISHEIIRIKQADLQLGEQFKQKQNEILTKYRGKGIKDKVKDKIRQIQLKEKTNIGIEISNLYKWALTERKKLYSIFKPLPLRCKVFKQDRMNNSSSLIDTNLGCESIAKIRKVNIVYASDGTVLDPDPTQLENEKEEQLSQDSDSWGKNLIPKIKSKQDSIFTQILRPNLQENKGISTNQIQKISEIVGNKKKFNYLDPILGFDNLPLLDTGEVYLILTLYHEKQKDLKILNYGILPMKFDDTKEIYIGREQLLRSFWKTPEFFVDFPQLFENIPSYSQEPLFILEIDDEGKMKAKSNSISFNQIQSRNNFNEIFLDKEENSKEYSTNTPFFIPIYYPLKERIDKRNTKFIIEFKIKN